jgi:hypothetical protein
MHDWPRVGRPSDTGTQTRGVGFEGREAECVTTTQARCEQAAVDLDNLALSVVQLREGKLQRSTNLESEGGAGPWKRD